MEYRKIEIARVTSELTTSYVYTDEILCKEYDFFSLLFDYRRRNDNGELNYKIEFSLDAITWYQSTIYDGGAVALGSDTESNIQREEFTYGGVGTPVNTFIYGPIELNQSAIYMRVAVREGSIGDKGDCGLKVVFTRRKQEVMG